MADDSVLNTLPPFLQEKVRAPGPDLVPPAQLADEMTALLGTWADLHRMLARSLAGEGVMREEAAAQFARLVTQAAESYRRVQR